MDGETVVVPAGTPLSEVPDDFRELLHADIEAAFVESDAFFKSLPERAVLPEFKQWLAMLAEAGLKTMELHTSEYVGNAVLLRFELTNGMSPAISLPQPEGERQLPETLHSIYQVIGSTKHAEWEMAGGLLPALEICSIAEMGTWLIDEPAEDPSQCHVFHGTPYGDNMCFKLDDTAVWYAHEIGDFMRFGTVRDFLSAYFAALTAGTELQPEY
jgi:hypothetical protein